MNKNPLILTIAAGFAIFTMFFGAANFMLPPTIGIMAGQKTLIASLAFTLTAVLLPMLGLVGIFLFEGSYNTFFGRLGTIPGNLIIALCMFIIGPGFVLPRIVNLCYEMLSPFFPVSLLVFSVIFALITFALSYRPTKLIDILGFFITPIKLSFVGFMIVLGLIKGAQLMPTEISTKQLVLQSLFYGYGTLDLLAAIFFGTIILEVFRKNLGAEQTKNPKFLIKHGLIASAIGGSLLALIYIGLSFLGAYHGIGLEGLNEGKILSTISLRIMGSSGALVGALAIMVACLATMIALSTVIGEYIQRDITKNKIGFVPSLIIILVITVALSLLGLTTLMRLSLKMAFILYPVLITLTVCNMAYKLFGFKWVKTPVLCVFLISAFVGLGGVDFCKQCLETYAVPALQAEQQ